MFENKTDEELVEIDIFIKKLNTRLDKIGISTSKIIHDMLKFKIETDMELAENANKGNQKN